MALDGVHNLLGNRILVVTKFRYLGDNIVATPFLRRLHRAMPNSDITLLSGPSIPTLLHGCPWINQFITKTADQVRGIGSSMQLAKELRAGKYDSVFLINRSLQSAASARFAGIPTRIGFNTEYRGLLLSHKVAYDWSKPDIDCALDLLRHIAIPAECSLPQLWVSEAEKDHAKAILAAHGIANGDFLIGLQAGTHDPAVREWGEAKYAELISALARDRKVKFVLLGAPEEEAVSQRVAKLSECHCAVLAGKTQLREALAIISHCRLWIGNDGGLLHAAAALAPASIGIFGHTKAARWGYQTELHKTIVGAALAKSSSPTEIRAGLDAISVETVRQTASNIMEISPK